MRHYVNFGFRSNIGLLIRCNEIYFESGDDPKPVSNDVMIYIIAVRTMCTIIYETYPDPLYMDSCKP